MEYLPTPPELPGYVWRPAERSDAPAIRQLFLACDAVSGGSDARPVVLYEAEFDNPDSAPATDTLVAAGANGELAALAWLSVSQAIRHQYRARLEGAVRPDYRARGVGGFLLDWMEARARQRFAALPDDRERVLRIEFTGARDDAIALYERHGFQFNHAEEIMRRDLGQPIPDVELPAGVALESFRPELAAAIYLVYADAFRERAGGVAWSEPAWASAFLGYQHFRPDYSFVAQAADELAAYVVCGIDPIENEQQAETEGWVLQIGVRPAYRRRGIASALICEVMRRFRAAGLAYTVLDVNVNNPTARRAYESLGFQVLKRYTVYQKTIT